MRFGPGVDYRIITTIRPGQIVHVMGVPDQLVSDLVTDAIRATLTAAISPPTSPR
jgi:hypothetical protein